MAAASSRLDFDIVGEYLKRDEQVSFLTAERQTFLAENAVYERVVFAELTVVALDYSKHCPNDLRGGQVLKITKLGASWPSWR